MPNYSNHKALGKFLPDICVKEDNYLRELSDGQ